jgi:inorganic pyrophosphatase
MSEVAHFFGVYKDLESAEVVGDGWEGPEQAWSEVERAVKRYRERVRDRA